VRHGAFGSYVVAAASAFVGSGRSSLAVAAIAIGVLQMVIWWMALLELTGWRAKSAGSARLLAFIVLPSPAMVYFGIYWPTAYPDQMLSAMVVLWTGARFWRRGGRGELCAFAFACGFAFWTSMLTLTVSVPVAVWALWQRRQKMPAPGDLALAVISAAVGMFPWGIFNLRYGWPSLHSNWAAAPVTGWEALGRNIARLFGEVGPGLIAARLGMDVTLSPTAIERWSDRLAALLVATLAFVLGGALWKRRRSRPAQAAGTPDLSALLALSGGLLATTMLVFVSSAAASGPGNIVRYVLPGVLVWPLLVALAWECASRAQRLAVAVLAMVLLAGYAAAVPWPWTAERRQLRIALGVETRMVELLESHGVEAIFGSYWETYPLIYESGGRLGGGTLEPGSDFHQFGEELPDRPCRWALVARSQRLMNAVERAGGRGERLKFSDGRWLFLPAPDLDAAQGAPKCRESLSALRALDVR
jgi:hypothetical protein